MSVKVLLPNAFQKHTNTREIESSAHNLPRAGHRDRGRAFRRCGSICATRRARCGGFINFYVNEEDIRFLGNEKYTFKEGDEVLVIPSIAGGCCSCCSYCGQEDCACC